MENQAHSTAFREEKTDMSLQDDYFDLEAELKGESKKRFLRIWKAFCQIEAEYDDLCSLRSAVRAMLSLATNHELTDAIAFPYDKINHRSLMAIDRVRNDTWQPKWIRDLDWPWTCHDFLNIGWLQMSLTRGMGKVSGQDIANALATVGYPNWMKT
jgi:hypothetical protein